MGVDRGKLLKARLSRARGFFRRERGAILVQSVIFSVALLGAAGLAVDFGRVYSLNVQMQAYADHVALAAATELDRKTHAIARATRVVDGYSDGSGGTSGAMIEKASQFMDGVDDILIEDIKFLSSLPDDPEPGSADYPIGDLGDLTTNLDSEAKFVVIVVKPEAVRFSFLSMLSIINADFGLGTTTNAVAVATLEQEICNVPPLMICNPWETGGGSFPPDSTIRGTQILAKTQGPGAAWAPGNFGFLQTVAGAGDPVCNGYANSAARIRCVFGLDEPNSACVNTTVNTSPGEAVSVYKGMNIRFDMWDPPLTSYKGTSTMTVAPNTIKGLTPQNANQCAHNKHDPATTSLALPRDPCFATGTCAFGRIGNKVTRTQLENYWAANHGDLPGGNDILPGYIVTRYEVYKHEILLQKSGINALGQLGPVGGPASDETGLPFCSTGGSAPAYNDLNEERRNMIMAVINCVSEGISGSATDVEVERFLDVFMTEPASEPGGGNSNTGGANLWIEVVGVLEAGGNDGKLHAFPVLVR